MALADECLYTNAIAPNIIAISAYRDEYCGIRQGHDDD